MIPECRLSFWNKFIPSPYLSLYLFTFLSHTSHSTMSSRFSVRIKFSFWYKISFRYHVNWKRALFRIENRKRVLSGEWGMRIWSGAKTTRVRTARLTRKEKRPQSAGREFYTSIPDVFNPDFTIRISWQTAVMTRYKFTSSKTDITICQIRNKL